MDGSGSEGLQPGLYDTIVGPAIAPAGRAWYVEHRSERPMQITWELHDPLPGDVFSAFRAAVA